MTKPLKIGGHCFATSVLLAPLAGYTDFAFRTCVRELGGLGLAFTEMLNPRSFLAGNARKARQLLATSPDDAPLSYQIYGHEPEVLADGSRWLADRGAMLIDINMGCPQQKIVRKGAGAGVLKNVSQALLIAESVVKAAGVPVSVKLRIPRTDDGTATAELARAMESTGVAAITLHARTCAQKFAGSADWLAIQAAVNAVKIPVIGNGDVMTPQDACRMTRQTGCAGVMIGRCALRYPWIIREAASALGQCGPQPAPSRSEHVDFLQRHLDRMAGLYGERIAPALFRRWTPQYAKGLRLEKPEMIRLLKLNDLGELRKAFDGLR